MIAFRRATLRRCDFCLSTKKQDEEAEKAKTSTFCSTVNSLVTSLWLGFVLWPPKHQRLPSGRLYVIFVL
jgi:hypothetical protein